MMNGGLNYSVTLDLTHPEVQEQSTISITIEYLSILQKVIAVDREID